MDLVKWALEVLRRMDTMTLNFQNLLEQLVCWVEILSEENELQFIQLGKAFEDFYKKCQNRHELRKYKDLLMKTKTEHSTLDVNLKLTGNQVDVEIKKRL